MKFSNLQIRTLLKVDMIDTQIQITGIKEVINNIETLKLSISGSGDVSMKQPLVESAQYMQREAIKNFPAKGGIMEEGGWAPLAKSTKEVKQGKVSFRTIKGQVVPMKPIAGDASNTPIMVRTGEMKDSFFISEPKISKNQGSIDVYNPLKIAKFHQFSNEQPRGISGSILPRRILLKLMDNHIKKIINIFEIWIGKSVQRSISNK